MPAEVVAIAGKSASSKMRALATSHALGRMSTPGPRWSCRNWSALTVWGSITSLVLTRGRLVLAGSAAASLFAHALDETGDVHHGASHRAAADFLRAVVGTDAHDVEAPVKRFQFRLGVNVHSDAAGGAVFDVDGDSHRDFTLVAIRVERIKAGRFHQPDHVGSRIHRRQFRMMRGERVLPLNGFSRFAAHADGDGPGHGIADLGNHGSLSNDLFSPDSQAARPAAVAWAATHPAGVEAEVDAAAE